MKLSRVFIIALMTCVYTGQALSAENPKPSAAAGKKALAPTIEDTLYIKKRKKPLHVLYKQVLLAFENNGYFVTFEPNISKSMRPFAQRWGKAYNTNNIEEIRSMVLSNPWYANKIANADPYLLAMFPLHVTLVQKGKITTILFVRPSKVAELSRGYAIAEELEKDVIRIFENIL